MSTCRPIPPARDRRPTRAWRRGSVLLYAAFVAVPVLVGLGGVAVDLGRAQLLRMQLKQVAESAARHGALGVAKGRFTAMARARSAATDPASRVEGGPLSNAEVTVEYGRWKVVQQLFVTWNGSNAECDAVRVTVTRTVGTSLLTVLGKSTATVGATSIAYLPGVTFVVGNVSPLSAGDAQVAQRLLAMGLPVLVADQNAVQGDWMPGRAVALVSHSVQASNVNSKFRAVTQPVVSYEPYVFGPMGMTGTTVNTDYGYTNSTSELRVRVADGPRFGVPSGTLLAVQDSAGGSGQGWGKPSPSAYVPITLATDSTRAAAFVYERGQSMVGLVAPGRRVGLYFFEPERNNATGWALFHAAIRLALGNNTEVVTVR